MLLQQLMGVGESDTTVLVAVNAGSGHCSGGQVGLQSGGWVQVVVDAWSHSRHVAAVSSLPAPHPDLLLVVGCATGAQTAPARTTPGLHTLHTHSQHVNINTDIIRGGELR